MSLLFDFTGNASNFHERRPTFIAEQKRAAAILGQRGDGHSVIRYSDGCTVRMVYGSTETTDFTATDHYADRLVEYFAATADEIGLAK